MWHIIGLAILAITPAMILAAPQPVVIPAVGTAIIVNVGMRVGVDVVQVVVIVTSVVVIAVVIAAANPMTVSLMPAGRALRTTRSTPQGSVVMELQLPAHICTVHQVLLWTSVGISISLIPVTIAFAWWLPLLSTSLPWSPRLPREQPICPALGELPLTRRAMCSLLTPIDTLFASILLPPVL